MRKIVIWLLATASAVGLAFAWKTSTEAIAPQLPVSAADRVTAPSPSTAPATSATTAPAAVPTTAPAAVPAPAPAAPASKDGTYVGAAANTRYGPVQVQITVSGGHVTALQAIDYPMSSGQDQEINSIAIPILNSEAMAAQSASISWVSGATYTSDGYLRSLQAALDQAGL